MPEPIPEEGELNLFDQFGNGGQCTLHFPGHPDVIVRTGDAGWFAPVFPATADKKRDVMSQLRSLIEQPVLVH